MSTPQTDPLPAQPRPGNTSRPTGNGSDKGRTGDPPDTSATADDPMYGLPILGPLIQQADRLRTRLPIGPAWNKGEAELLRAEARALHTVARLMEARAKHLDRLERVAAATQPRVRRVPVE